MHIDIVYRSRSNPQKSHPTYLPHQTHFNQKHNSTLTSTYQPTTLFVAILQPPRLCGQLHTLDSLIQTSIPTVLIPLPKVTYLIHPDPEDSQPYRIVYHLCIILS